MTNPLVGVWEMESDTEQGRLIFTETHFSYLFTAKNSELFSSQDDATEAEEAAAFRTMRAASGTYSISGPVFTYSYDLVQFQHIVGHTGSIEFAVAGDTMTGPSPSISREPIVWRKTG